MGHLEVPRSLWKCQKPSGSAKSPLKVPKAIWKCQEPSGSGKRTPGSAKIPVEEPKAIWKSQEPAGSAKSLMAETKAIWKCQEPSGRGKAFPRASQRPAFSLRASSGLGGIREAQTIMNLLVKVLLGWLLHYHFTLSCRHRYQKRGQRCLAF